MPCGKFHQKGHEKHGCRTCGVSEPDDPENWCPHKKECIFGTKCFWKPQTKKQKEETDEAFRKYLRTIKIKR